MTFSAFILIAGLAIIIMSGPKDGLSSMMRLGVFLTSAGFTSLAIYLVGGGPVADLVVLISILLLIFGAYLIHMAYTKRKNAQKSDLPKNSENSTQL